MFSVSFVNGFLQGSIKLDIMSNHVHYSIAMLSVTLQNEYFFPQSRGDSEEKRFRLEIKCWHHVIVVVSARFYSISSRLRFDSISNCDSGIPEFVNVKTYTFSRLEIG